MNTSWAFLKGFVTGLIVMFLLIYFRLMSN